MNGEVVVTDDVAGTFASAVRQAFEDRANADQFSMAFGGGSTARSCYKSPAHVDIDWAMVTAIWGDERAVPLDHEDSNYRIAKEELFDQVTPLGAVHPIDDTTDADAYDKIVRDLGAIDFVHLGMGDDGHTASLFPDSPALHTPPGKLVVAAGDDLHKHPRITLTFEALNHAQLCVFTVIGAAKAEMFARIKNGDDLPAAQVNAAHTLWIVDPAAAGR